MVQSTCTSNASFGATLSYKSDSEKPGFPLTLGFVCVCVCLYVCVLLYPALILSKCSVFLYKQVHICVLICDTYATSLLTH